MTTSPASVAPTASTSEPNTGSDDARLTRRPVIVTAVCAYAAIVGGLQLLGAFLFTVDGIAFVLRQNGVDVVAALRDALVPAVILAVVGGLSLAGGLLGLRRFEGARPIIVVALVLGLVLIVVSVARPMFVMFGPYLYIVGNIAVLIALYTKDTQRWFRRAA